MTNAVTAQWHGHNYQARIFWEHALNLLIPTSCVVEVTFEADGPKAFDDVVVRYAPAVARSGPERVTAEYHQVKWHVEYGGRFGYEDFTKPEFIGAKTVSLLERLKQARALAGPGAGFAFLTTYRVRDDDPLAQLVSGNDKSLLTEHLFDGTTDKSRMGKVRKLWREHLGLTTDEELRSVVAGLRILEGHRSLAEVRAEINLKAQVVGLLACSASDSDFRYDELARQLKIRGCNVLTREVLERLSREEGLVAATRAEPDGFRPVAIRSFLGAASDITVALPDDTLSLTDEFRQRYLQDGRDWQADVRPRVEAFLRAAIGRSSKLRLHLDAHASIAFLAGSVLDLKSGAEVHLIQKGRVGSRTWYADDGTSGERLEEGADELGTGNDLAVGVGVSQAVEDEARGYIARYLPQVGAWLSFSPPGGPSQRAVMGGAHASDLAEQMSNAVRRRRRGNHDTVAHIFAACPNSLLYYLGQHHQAVAPCIVYEYDFDRQGNKSYQPSFIMT